MGEWGKGMEGSQGTRKGAGRKGKGNVLVSRGFNLTDSFIKLSRIGMALICA